MVDWAFGILNEGSKSQPSDLPLMLFLIKVTKDVTRIYEKGEKDEIRDNGVLN